MKKINPVFGHFICAVLIFGVFLGIAPFSYAINTVFMVPPIGKDYVHPLSESQPPPAVQQPETPPAVQQEPVTDEPLYALPLKGPNTTRIIVFCSVGIAAAAACAAVIIVKKKK